MWVGYDTVTMDVLADGTEAQVRYYARGEVTIMCATEDGWRRAAKARDPATLMSGNPPRGRNGKTVIHLLAQ